MRALAVASALAAALAPAPASAESPVSLPQLAPGEVLLEVDGVAVVRVPATSATVTSSIHGQGDSEEAARRELDREIQRVTAAARAAGADPADIVVEPGPSTSEPLRVFDVDEPPAPDAETAEPPLRTHFIQATIFIRLRDARRARELHNRVGGADQLLIYGGPAYGGVAYDLDDDSAARSEARRRALAAARADAEALAAAAGMRIVRTVRITERAGLDFGGLLVTERNLARRIGPRRDRSDDAIVDIVAVVGVDYVMAPR